MPGYHAEPATPAGAHAAKVPTGIDLDKKALLSRLSPQHTLRLLL